MKRACLVHGNHTPGSDWERECPLRNAERETEKQTLLQRLGFRRPGAAAEPEPRGEPVVETAAVSPEDAAEVVGPLADRPTSAEIRELIRRELASSMDAEVAAAEAHKA